MATSEQTPVQLSLLGPTASTVVSVSLGSYIWGNGSGQTPFGDTAPVDPGSYTLTITYNDGHSEPYPAQVGIPVLEEWKQIWEQQYHEPWNNEPYPLSIYVHPEDSTEDVKMERSSELGQMIKIARKA